MKHSAAVILLLIIPFCLMSCLSGPSDTDQGAPPDRNPEASGPDSAAASALGERMAGDGWDISVLDTGRNADYLTETEKDVLLLMNAVRTDPALFGSLYVTEYRSNYNGRYLQFPGEITIMTNEGIRAVDELLRYLQNASSMQVLQPSRGMSRAAADHVADQGPSGRTGHTGNDGSSMSARINRYGRWQSGAGENISYGYATAMKIVMQLLVDDGVSSRGHRKNIMNGSFNAAGIAVGSHAAYGYMCVIDFANGYTESQ
jgi:hypothetical protein